MAGNGLVHTLASVLSPAAGALLVAKLGFTNAFSILGMILIVTAVFALIFLKEAKSMPAQPATQANPKSADAPYNHSINDPSNKTDRLPWNIFLIPVGLSCALGILSFELPLMLENQDSIMKTGMLFTIISIGSLITLCMLFINRFNPAYRTLFGTMALTLLYFLLAAQDAIPFMLILLLIGMCKGIVFPALSHWLIVLSKGERYGRTFSVLAIASSIGAFLGPFLAGQLRDYISPYFISFIVLTVALAFNALPERKSPHLSSNVL